MVAVVQNKSQVNSRITVGVKIPILSSSVLGVWVTIARMRVVCVCVLKGCTVYTQAIITLSHLQHSFTARWPLPQAGEIIGWGLCAL